MAPDELRALADALEPMAKAPRFAGLPMTKFCAWLRQCAEQRPGSDHSAIPSLAGGKLIRRSA